MQRLAGDLPHQHLEALFKVRLSLDAVSPSGLAAPGVFHGGVGWRASIKRCAFPTRDARDRFFYLTQRRARIAW